MIGDSACEDGAELGVLVLAALAARARGVVDHALGELRERSIRIARNVNHGVRDAELAIRRREESCEPRRARLRAIPRDEIAERTDAEIGRVDRRTDRRLTGADFAFRAFAASGPAIEASSATIRGKTTLISELVAAAVRRAAALIRDSPEATIIKEGAARPAIGFATLDLSAAAVGEGPALAGAENLGRLRDAFGGSASAGGAMLSRAASSTIDRTGTSIAHVSTRPRATRFFARSRLTPVDLASVEAASNPVIIANADAGDSLASRAIDGAATAIIVEIACGRTQARELGASKRPTTGTAVGIIRPIPAPIAGITIDRLRIFRRRLRPTGDKCNCSGERQKKTKRVSDEVHRGPRVEEAPHDRRSITQLGSELPSHFAPYGARHCL